MTMMFYQFSIEISDQCIYLYFGTVQLGPTTTSLTEFLPYFISFRFGGQWQWVRPMKSSPSKREGKGIFVTRD
jgi:hypothetical protein